MLHPFIWLFVLCLAMLVSSFIAGCIPLTTKLSASNLSYLTAVSAGLLISTSLCVIIPEGVETLYDNAGKEAHVVQEHTLVGLCLLIGFGSMFMVDQFSAMHVHVTPTSTATAHIDQRTSVELDAMLKPTEEQEEGSTSAVDHEPTRTDRLTVPTVGLIVHAAADGIALGASVSDPQLSMVVFFAIMLHKAPSAFALSTVLLNEGLSRVRVRQHLLMFSISAPLGALFTFLILQSGAFQSLPLEYWTGALLLFSGGTFLYVAMHTLQESQGGSYRISCILLGMLIPFVLNLNHSH